MANRQVILLINRFSGYYLRINLLQEEFPQKLTNTKIMFLPTSVTSVCQLLNQSIIKALSKYEKFSIGRNRFVFYILSMNKTKIS